MKNYIKICVAALFMNSVIFGSCGDELTSFDQKQEFQGVTYDELTMVPSLYYTWREPVEVLAKLGICGAFEKYPLEMPISVTASLATSAMLLYMKYHLRNNPNAFTKVFGTACGVIFVGEFILKNIGE